MMYPLVRELAAKDAPIRVPVTVTCRVLNIARQPYYRWLISPVAQAELVQAYRANALFDAHRDDPEFGYRYLLEEAADAGLLMCERTAWAICSQQGWWSVSRVRLCGRTIESVLKESQTHGKTTVDSGREEDPDRVECDCWRDVDR